MSEWQQVSFAVDCEGYNEETGELGDICSVCGLDYCEDCQCPGPTQDGYEYEEIAGVLMARKTFTMTEKPDTRQEGGNHYLAMSIQPTRYNQLNMITWHPANIVKYVCRYKRKGEPLKDLRKALHYTQLQIQMIDEESLTGGKVVGFRISPETFIAANDLPAPVDFIVATVSRYPWDIEKLDEVCSCIELLIKEYA